MPDNEAAAEEAAPAPEENADEEDGPLEDWTKKELAAECKTLGLSDKGTKAALIARIKEAKAAAEAAAAAANTEGSVAGPSESNQGMTIINFTF